MNVTMSGVSVAWDARISSDQAQGGAMAGLDPAQARTMLRECVAEAAKEAAAILQREDGMPRYVADLVGRQADALLADDGRAAPDRPYETGGPDPRDGWVQTGGPDPREGWQTKPMEERPLRYEALPESNLEGFRQAFRELAGELTRSIVDAVRQELKNGSEGAGGETGGSWMQAIARAMGNVMGQKAARMVELSEKIQGLSGRGGTGDASKMEAAAETQRLNTEFQATGQEFNLLQTTFSTAIKTLGEGMASVARRN